ncbi:DUF1622 domain-containing protein [uncultured Sphingomonas sp.]|uniref:DUF1622 domain-containing protein n=1 Tax=uncultured Sphingomonas sp. TaxID=158754 RepID=UPI0025CDAAB7|nr:DUF1622 domain-containing protein [uncultured Sphingomonas sp.]
MEEYLKTGTLFLSSLAEGAAGLVIAFAVLEAIVRSVVLFLPAQWRGSATHHLMEKEEVRLRLGRWLAVALEFLLAADILRTAVAPSWDEIGKLAAVATLRTVLNYFLQKEIDRARVRSAEPSQGG